MPDDNSGLNGSDVDVGGVQPAGIDPNSVAIPKRGRGRPAGTGKPSEPGRPGTASAAKPARAAQAKKASHLDVGAISLAVGMLGGFIAKFTKQPTLALDEEETDLIAKAGANVAQFYDVPVSPVQQAWIGLARTVGTIYAAKISALKVINAAKKATPENTPAII